MQILERNGQRITAILPTWGTNRMREEFQVSLSPWEFAVEKEESPRKSRALQILRLKKYNGQADL